MRHLIFSIALFLTIAASPASAQGLDTQGAAMRGRAELSQMPFSPGWVRPPGRDGRVDGLIKGALLGVLVAVVLEKGHGDGGQLGPRDWATLVAYGAGTGYVIDALRDRDPGPRRGASPPGALARFRVRF